MFRMKYSTVNKIIILNIRPIHTPFSSTGVVPVRIRQTATIFYKQCFACFADFTGRTRTISTCTC